jgi:hypothetical protein
MTQEEFAQYIRDAALKREVDPGEADRLWKQESGRSTDPYLKGPDLSHGRGNAMGPFQVVPYYHPNFPVGGDPRAQADYALDLYKKVGPEKYYGEGPHSVGPTTEQYAAAVRGGQDVRQASNNPNPNVPSGNPRSGMMYQDRPMPTLPPFPQVPQQAPEQASQALNPLMAILMGASLGKGSMGARLASGAGLAGMALRAGDMAENDLLDLKQKRAARGRDLQQQDSMGQWFQQMAQSEDPQIAEIGKVGLADSGEGIRLYTRQQGLRDNQSDRNAKAAQYLAAGGSEIGAARIRAGYAPEAPESFGPPSMSRDPTNPNAVVPSYSGNRGTQRTGEPIPLPIAHDPKALAEEAGAGASGKTQGEAQGKAAGQLPAAELRMQQALDTVDELLTHPGRESATGASSYIPWMRGSNASDYAIKLNKATGGAFLQAYEVLKGGGQITEIEGQKATQAITDMSLAQSDDAHRKALLDYKNAVRAGYTKLQQAARRGVQIPGFNVDQTATQEPVSASPSNNPDPLGLRR